MEEIIKSAHARDAKATQARLIEAAQIVFTELGYDGASTREIADRAGVNIRLLNRYFGSKMGLFKESVLPGLGLGEFDQVPLAELPELFAELYTTKTKDGIDPMLAMIRSLGNSEALGEIKHVLENQLIGAFADRLTGEAARERASMIMAVLAGVDLTRRVVKVGTFETQGQASLARILRALMLPDDL